MKTENTDFFNPGKLERKFEIKFPFDPREELDRAVKDLRRTIPMESNSIRNSGEEARIAKKRYDKVLAQVNLAQQRYLERLNQAKKSGAIDSSDHFRAMSDLMSPQNPFERVRREAIEAYRENTKRDVEGRSDITPYFDHLRRKEDERRDTNEYLDYLRAKGYMDFLRRKEGATH